MLSLKTELSSLIPDTGFSGSANDWCMQEFGKGVNELTEDELIEALFRAKEQVEKKRQAYNFEVMRE